MAGGARFRLPALLALFLLAPSAAAHATLVLGGVTSEPDPPQPGEPIVLTLELGTPTGVPVEDAVVLVELSTEGAATTTARFTETQPGRYRAEVSLERPGAYRLRLRDRTFRQEEVGVTLDYQVGGSANGLQSFVFPPTATGQRNVAVWLAWVIGLPLVAAVVVTVVVLRGGRASQEPEGADGTSNENP